MRYLTDHPNEELLFKRICLCDPIIIHIIVFADNKYKNIWKFTQKNRPAKTGRSKHYFLPVEPKPPAPRSVSSKRSVSSNTAVTYGAMTSCAMRSPGAISCGSDEWL